VEFLFPEGESFKHYNLKWVDYNKMKVAVVTNPDYEKRLREYTVKVFRALKGNGYARCDFRFGADGEFYMLEINPNCGIFYPPTDAGSADFCLMNDPMGHQGFMELIIRCALNRQAEALRITPQIVGKRELVKQDIGKSPARRQTIKREVSKRGV
jgi:D-alanine-D-alanine ligase